MTIPHNVSVLIPARNAAATLAQTLDSLLAQGHRGWEAIIVDDGSTDQTAEVARGYLARDARFHLLAGNGSGVSAARNHALSIATGEWLLFLDSDDWIAPTFMARMLSELATDTDAAVCCCAYQRVTPSGDLLPLRFEPEIAKRPGHVFARSSGLAIHSFIMRRELVVRLGGFDATLRTCEDWDLWQRIAASGARFIAIDEALAFYRMSRGSLTRDTQAMLNDARSVIQRGFDRIGVAHDDPERQEALFFFTLWVATQAAAASVFRPEAMAHAPEISGLGDKISDLVVTIFDALTVGALCTPAEVAGRWPTLQSQVVRIVELLDARAAAPGFKRRLLAGLDQRVIAYAPLERPAVLGTTLALRCAVANPVEIIAPAGIDALHLRLYDGNTCLAWIDMSIVGRVTACELQSIMVATLGLPAYAKIAAQSPAPALRAAASRLLEKRRVDANHLRQASLIRRARAVAQVSSPAVVLRNAAAVPARQVLGGDAVMRRADAWATETTTALPVLMYHRISTEGPARLARYRVTPAAFREQMRWLRRHGYHAVSPAEVADHFEAQRPFSGRPVLITFDDGTLDFAETAWPILRDHDLRATNFIVTGHVGGTADWDRAFGEPARLMNWQQITALHAEGARFGSHLVTHTAIDGLSSNALIDELASSAATLSARLGADAVAMAAPYGIIDTRVERLLKPCGYRLGFTTAPGTAKFGDPPGALPRIEVTGDMDVAAFAGALGRGDDTQGLVTVVIPAYNAARTIDETLRSVRSQTHAMLEILVVDDGSTDATPDIVRSHARRDDRITLLSQPNAGVAAARNLGAQQATADLIAFIDSDDLWATTKIEKQVEALRRGGPRVGLAYTWFALIDDESRILDANTRPTESGDVLERMCFGNLVGNGSSALVRKAAFLQAGGFDPSLRARNAQGCEDLQFYFRVAEGHDFAVVPEVLTGYRRAAGNMSSDVMQMIRSRLRVSELMQARQPKFTATIRRGDAEFAAWLLCCALTARRFDDVVELCRHMLATDPVGLARGLKDNLPRLRASLSRSTGSGEAAPVFTIGDCAGRA